MKLFADTTMWQLVTLSSQPVPMQVALRDCSCSSTVLAGQLAQPAFPDADRSVPPLTACWPQRKVLQPARSGDRGLLPVIHRQKLDLKMRFSSYSWAPAEASPERIC